MIFGYTFKKWFIEAANERRPKKLVRKSPTIISL
jgi:hypothetical protein